MRYVGVDIAKVGLSAVALAVAGEPRRASVWKPANERDYEPAKLDQYAKWLKRQFWILKPDVIAVEQLAVFQNKKVIRALSHFEGVALLEAERFGAIVINPTVGSSRNIVLGINANSKKEVAWAEAKKQIDFDFGLATSGGYDKADAMVHALAAPTHIRRSK
jgi:Holliday junction resolvasome RuvABC endonuclease subunit